MALPESKKIVNIVSSSTSTPHWKIRLNPWHNKRIRRIVIEFLYSNFQHCGSVSSVSHAATWAKEFNDQKAQFYFTFPTATISFIAVSEAKQSKVLPVCVLYKKRLNMVNFEEVGWYLHFSMPTLVLNLLWMRDSSFIAVILLLWQSNILVSWGNCEHHKIETGEKWEHMILMCQLLYTGIRNVSDFQHWWSTL